MGNQQTAGVPAGGSSTAAAAKGEPVTVNVYEPTDPQQASIAGMGVHHSGIELFGVEYCFAGGNSGGSGVCHQAPKVPPSGSGWKFKESVVIGKADISRNDWERTILPELESLFPASNYHLVTCNCNDFSEAVAKKLRLPFPDWINRAAMMGRKFVEGPKAPTVEPMKAKVNVFASSAGHRLADGVVISAEERKKQQKATANASAGNTAASANTAGGGGRKNPWRDPNFYPAGAKKDNTGSSAAASASN